MKKENYEEHKLEWQKDATEFWGEPTTDQENKYDATKEKPKKDIGKIDFFIKLVDEINKKLFDDRKLFKKRAKKYSPLKAIKEL